MSFKCMAPSTLWGGKKGGRRSVVILAKGGDGKKKLDLDDRE